MSVSGVDAILLNRLVRGLMDAHPRPWNVGDGPRCIEVYDACHVAVMGCDSAYEAEALIEIVSRIDADDAAHDSWLEMSLIPKADR